MRNKNVTDVTNVESSEVVRDARVVIVLDKLLAALDYNDTKTKSNIPKVT